MLRFYTIIAFCFWVSQAAFTLEEYNKRQKTVNYMNDLYEKFLTVPISEEQKRSGIQQEFKKICDSSFKKSDAWFFDALNDTSSSLIAAQLKSNKFNITKTKPFIETAFKTVGTAISMGFWCSVLKENETEAKRLVKFNEDVERQKPSLTKTLTSRLDAVFRKSVVDVVTAWLSSNHFRYNDAMQKFMQLAATKLREAYPVGQWVTVAFANSEKRTLCSRPGTFSYWAPAEPKWSFGVYLLKDGQKFNVKAADDALKKIKSNREGSNCEDDMNYILKDAGYTCNSDKFTFFGIFSNALFGASEPSLFRERDVSRSKRWGWTCTFKVGILV